MQIKTKDMLQIAAIMCAGIMANPTSGCLLNCLYDRQQLINQVFQDVHNSILSMGIAIIDLNEDKE
ncbi:MAG: hypothetical protein PHD05_00455 [Sphaerochaetaceae bacterium]|nr:hypothetical protein [Sphaerochaetaceae bacterium]